MTDDYTLEDVLRARELRDDDSLDEKQVERHEAGWLKFYVECPNCEVPMTRTSVEVENPDVSDDEVSRTKHVVRALCPACGEMQTTLTIYEATHQFGEKHRRADDE